MGTFFGEFHTNPEVGGVVVMRNDGVRKQGRESGQYKEKGYVFA